jgi:hypothetical protein
MDKSENSPPLGRKKFGCSLPKEATADDKNFRFHSDDQSGK